MTQELREKVAHLFRTMYATEADRRIAANAAISIIRAETLEEAARVADRNADEAWQEGAEETRGLMRLQAADIAAAIHALKEKS